MTELHAQIIEKDGKKEFAVLPYDDYVKLREALEDFEDLKILKEAQREERDAPVLTLAQVKSLLSPKTAVDKKLAASVKHDRKLQRQKSV